MQIFYPKTYDEFLYTLFGQCCDFATLNIFYQMMLKICFNIYHVYSCSKAPI